jgi:hypothetical protein
LASIAAVERASVVGGRAEHVVWRHGLIGLIFPVWFIFFLPDPVQKRHARARKREKQKHGPKTGNESRKIKPIKPP